MQKNLPLDAGIIADTDYLRQYLDEVPDIILDEVDEDESDMGVIDAAITHACDPRFEDVVDRIVELALEGDELRNRLAETIHGSWLWEPLSNMCDDVSVEFMREAATKAKEMVRNAQDKAGMP